VKLVVKPTTRKSQLAINSRFGSLHQLGSLVGGETEKEAQFDHARLSGV